MRPEPTAPFWRGSSPDRSAKGWARGSPYRSPTHVRLPKYRELLARGTLRAEASPTTSATLKFTYQRNRGADYLYQDLIGCRSDVRTYAAFDDCRLNGRGESTDPSQWSGFDAPFWRDEPCGRYNTYIASLSLEHQLDEHVRVASLTGYSRIDNQCFDNIISRSSRRRSGGDRT